MMRNDFGFEIKTADDLSFYPQRWNNEQDGHAVLYCVDSIATFHDEGNDKAPINMFRHMNTDGVRFAGIVRLGEGPLSFHRALHTKDLAQKKDLIVSYRKIGSDPLCYAYRCEDPFVEYRFYEDHIEWKEGKDGCILDVRLDPFPYAFFIHRCEQFPVSTFYSHPHLLSGTYMGKKIIGIGNDDRQYIPNDHDDRKEREKNYQKTTEYLTANCSGVREDGRREHAFFNGALGHMCGGYWLEGEEPVISDDVKLIGEWIRLPYMNDGTCVMKDFTFIIKNKKIRFCGKWGLKGWGEETDTDKIPAEGPSFGNRHGESQIMGTFYEGDTPYRHKVWQTFVENMEAYDHKLIKAGYTIKEGQ